MGDVGPQHVALWRNLLGAGLIGLAAIGIVTSLAGMVRNSRRDRQMKRSDGRDIQFQ
jgi:uncharacterized membrane protein YidH (DUF202 family)